MRQLFKDVIIQLIKRNNSVGTRIEIALRLMPQILTNEG